MVIGNGMIAKAFSQYKNNPKVLLFASGVSRSNEKEEASFLREKELIKSCIKKYPTAKFVYFSSCALVDDVYLNIPYYKHKYEMELLIDSLLESYLIIRLPQAFGIKNNSSQLIGYLLEHLRKDKPVDLIRGANRYLIDINDVIKIVDTLLSNQELESKKTLDVANLYPYSIKEIVEVLENIVQKKLNYTFLDASTGNINLDLREINDLNQKLHLQIPFGKNYFFEKMKMHYTKQAMQEEKL